MARTETRPVESILVENRFRKDLGDIHVLAKNIDEIGLLQPIVVTPDGRLIAGQRRHLAFKYLGKTEIPVHVVNLDEIIRGEFAENMHRKDFTASEISEIADAVEELERERAKKRQGTRTDLVENCPDVNFGKTRDKIAEQLGTSGRSLDKIRFVVRAAKEEPERFGKYVEGMDETGNVDRSIQTGAGPIKSRREEEPPDHLP
jgi:ParB family transcriptional regulator, chromosome partitioning protein